MGRSGAVYRVRYSEKLWNLEGDSLLQTFPTRDEAVAAGRRLAEQPAAGELQVYHCDGTLARQYLYHGEPRPSMR